MRILVLASTLAIATGWLASPALAQMMPGMGLPLNRDAKSLSPEEQERQAAIDKAYKESLKKIPNQAAPNDPWGSARAAETPKTAPAAKPAQKKSTATAN
ncbi:MAG: hypothetical protein A4S14_16800 [Proteobacteria bacterium SG_bin9]|nr:MAG: hypothetical protein A4S14_16800 [Proteobacteria bacterium SG_bin9]